MTNVAAFVTVLFAVGGVPFLLSTWDMWVIERATGAAPMLIHVAPTWLVPLAPAALLRGMAMRRGLLVSLPLVRMWYPAATIALTVAALWFAYPFVFRHALMIEAFMVIQAATAVRCAWLLGRRPASPQL